MSAGERERNRRNWETWMSKLKGTYLGKVADPEIAKLAPFVKFGPKEFRYGVK